MGAGEEKIILDAGTGIRPLGEKLKSEGSSKRVSIFLSHFHWDHIHGLPFFGPAYDPTYEIRIVAPAPDGADIEDILRAQMGPTHFPIPYDALSAKISFHGMNEGPWEGTKVRVRSIRVRHASFTVAYRVEAFGRSVVFIPDNELVGGDHATPGGWMGRMIEFASGADLLLHDAMFTNEEYRTREGWGHSTFSQALELAEQASVKRLDFFHHSPNRSDEELDGIVRHFREEVGVRGLKLDIHAAAEGTRFTLG